jgi:pimeloyl-ACP methyl ester carboxylesterase
MNYHQRYVHVKVYAKNSARTSVLAVLVSLIWFAEHCWLLMVLEGSVHAVFAQGAGEKPVSAGGSVNPAATKRCADVLQPYTFTVKKQRLANGLDIAYVDEGNRESKNVLVFVHGLASYLPAWDKNISALRSEYRCVALDLPGYGRSSTSSTISIQFYSTVLAEFLDSLKLPSVTVLGHQFGAQVCMRAALRFPQKIKRLVLIAPAGIEQFNEEQCNFIRQVYTPRYTLLKPNNVVQADYERGFYNFPKDAEFMFKDRWSMTEAIDFHEYCATMAKCVRASIDEPILKDLRKLAQPTLIVFGTEDNMIPSALMHPTMTTQDIAEQAHKAIKNSTLLMIPDCGHFAQFEKPDIVNAAIRDFVR